MDFWTVVVIFITAPAAAIPASFATARFTKSSTRTTWIVAGVASVVAITWTLARAAV